jgi:hypothetical protein
VEQLRQHGYPDGVSARVRGEQAARELLDAKAGRFERKDGQGLAHHVQTSFWNGFETHVRFAPAFAGGAWSSLLTNLESFNAFTERMWNGTEAQALSALDEVYRDHQQLPWAAPSYPSLLMYLRDPDRFMVAISRLTTGLERVTRVSYPLHNGEQYLAYCASAHHLQRLYSLEPQEVDLVLWGVTESLFSSVAPVAVAPPKVEDPVLPADAAPTNPSDDELESWLQENEGRASVLPDTYLASRAAAAPRTPLLRATAGQGYVRDAYVSMLAKRLAQGRCDLCREKAPFFDKADRPYLEAHHVVWLSRSGFDEIANVVALCPNCHRKMHVHDSNEDVGLLIERIRQRRPIAI